MLNRRLLPILAVLSWVASLVGLGVGIATQRVLLGPVLAVPTYGAVGAFLGVKRPTNLIAWLLIAMACEPLLALAFGLPPEVQNGVMVAALALVLVLFPTGSPPSRRWWLPMALVVVSWIGTGSFGAVVLAGGFEVPIGVVLAAGSLLVCAAAPIVRFRSAGGIERSQLRWLGAAAGMTMGAVLLAAAGFATGFKPLVDLGAPLAVLGLGIGLPGAILIAILRYRLYDIERIVSRTVTYAAVALVVSAVYALPVLFIPELIGASSDVITAGATLAAATAFNPVRRRVRAAVDRRFNRSAYDAALEVDRLAAALRDSVDLDAVSRGLVATATRALQPGSVAVWLRL